MKRNDKLKYFIVGFIFTFLLTILLYPVFLFITFNKFHLEYFFVFLRLGIIVGIFIGLSFMRDMEDEEK